MSYQGREIEIKLEVMNNWSFAKVDRAISELYAHRSKRIIKGIGVDTYFKPPVGAKADFVRVRDTTNGLAQITLKYTDKATNVDRVEKEADTSDTEMTIEIFKDLLGPPLGTIEKKYTVYFLDSKDSNISVYQVRDDDRVFVEIEARTMEKVNQIRKLIEDEQPMEFKQVNKSLFQIFVLEKQS